jgi:hypothetical protein
MRDEKKMAEMTDKQTGRGYGKGKGRPCIRNGENGNGRAKARIGQIG